MQVLFDPCDPYALYNPKTIYYQSIGNEIMCVKEFRYSTGIAELHFIGF